MAVDGAGRQTNSEAGPLGEDGSAEFERVLLDAISDLGEGVVVTDAGRCVWANDAYCQLTGYTLEELRDLPSLTLLAPDDEREVSIQRLKQRLAGGEVQDHYEASLVRKNGQRRRVESAVKMVPTDAGLRIIAVIRDVTDREQLEEFRKHFAARVSHEFKNVVAPLTGFVEMLTENWDQLDPTTRQAMFDGLQRQGTKLTNLMDRMLDLAKFERGEFNLQPQRVHLRAVVQNVVDIQQAVTEKTIVNAVEAGSVGWIDPIRLDQILTNLVTNAVKYGGDRITIEAAEAHSGVEVRVHDDGLPLDPSEAARLFDAFVRGPTAETQAGAGLGLAISRAYARASGGDLVYEAGSEGKRFVLCLPPEPTS